MTLRNRLLLLAGLGGFALIVIGATSVLNLKATRDEWKRILAVDQAKRRHLTDIRSAMGYGDRAEEALSAIEAYRGLGPLTESERESLARIETMIQDYLSATRTAQRLLGERRTVREIDRALSIEHGPYVEEVATLSREADLATERRVKALENRIGAAGVFLGVLVAVAIVLLVLAVQRFARRTVRPLESVVEACDAITRGDSRPRDLDTTTRGEIGDLARSFRAMTEALAGYDHEMARMHEAVRTGDLRHRCREHRLEGEWANRLGRVNLTVEALAAPTRIAADYLNRLTRGELPPSLPPDLSGPCEEMRESLDRFVQTMTALHAEARALTEGVRDGRLEARGDTSSLEGRWGELIRGMNEMIEAVAHPVRRMARTVHRIGRGDIPPRIEASYRGEFDGIREDLNRCIDVTNDLTTTSRRLIESAREGKLDAVGDSAGFDGELDGSWAEIFRGMTEVLVGMMNPLRETMRIMGALESGILTETMEGRFPGEYGALRDGVNASIQSLSRTIGRIADKTSRIAARSADVVRGSSDLNERCHRRASAIEDAAATMEQMASAVRQNADHAREARRLAQEARERVEHGRTAFARSIEGMDEIDAGSKRTSEIVGMIDELSFQTSLLALNASVEAARAGEWGRGFAVVAEEVRNLARRSAEAAREISVLIREGDRSVENGIALVRSSGETLKEIVEATRRVSDIVAEIAVSNEEQALGIEQMNTTIAHLDEGTRREAALVEETTGATRSLDREARELQELVAFFRTDGAADGDGDDRTNGRGSGPSPKSDSQGTLAFGLEDPE
jgi:methyl-accepting chemotaxis protein